MAVIFVEGARDWSMERDDEGHRNYDISHIVECTGDGNGDDYRLEGLSEVSIMPGLPAIGSTWDFDGDVDTAAYCAPYIKVTAYDTKPGEKPTHYLVEQKFTTKAWKRCQDQTVENPLLEPQKVSGTFEKYTREASMNKDGQPLATSSHELYRGSQVEVDGNRPTVKIQQNVADLDLPLISRMMGKVNDAELWGLAARCVKLSSASWERLVQGRCNFYYQRSFEFDIAYETFDRRLLDHSRKSLIGRQVHLDFGCTVDITVDVNGRVENVTLNQGGVGYEPNATINLMVLGKAPARGCVIACATNGSGTVTSISPFELNKGYGYKAGSGLKTQLEETTWAPINRNTTDALDPANPLHTQRVKDAKGASVTILLDGEGKPATSGTIQYDVDGNPIPGAGSPFYRDHQIYSPDNLLLLGIPASLTT